MSSGPTALAGLDARQFARAFPYHLRLDGQLRVLGAGTSLCKAVPALQAGVQLLSLFEVRRPRVHASLDDWSRHVGQMCTLRSRGDPPLTLRGSPECLADGTLALLVSPVLGSIEEVTAHGLGLEDFARHDAAGDLLLLARTVQMSARDAERLAARLRERTTQLATMLALSDSAVAYFDGEDRLLQANEVLSDLLGLPPERLLGCHLDTLRAELTLRLEPDEPQRDPLQAAIHAAEAATADVDGAPAPPSRAALRVRLAAPCPRVVEIRTRHSPDGGRVVFMRDVTHESEVDRMKSEFLSAAAHELRTPMASIYGFTELLLHRPVPEAKRRELLGTIHRQTGQLIHIVNELLDLARIESRRGQDLAREPQPLRPLVQAAVAAQHLAAGQRVRVIDDRLLDATVRVDAGKFGQALGNVLSNACKFSPPGAEIVIHAVAGRSGEAPAIGVRVCDPGIGMTPEQCRRVFERFYRADASRSVPGSGLGMSLVKEIVELHGGRVEIDSEPRRGTRVTLWWPRAEADRLDGVAEARADAAH